jgi:hypothetical protein
MDLQNLAYALTQVVHNFGAVAVVGGGLLGRWPRIASAQLQRPIASLVLAGWLLQVASGAGFGAISFAYYGQFPDIHGIALAALYLKMVCAVGGIVLAVALLHYQDEWSSARQTAVWHGLALFGVTALAAAAFLRWFS